MYFMGSEFILLIVISFAGWNYIICWNALTFSMFWYAFSIAIRTLILIIQICVLYNIFWCTATTAEDDSHESPTKSNTALPFSFWDKLPFLTKEFSSYEPIPHDERFLKELVFNDKEICPKPSFEEIIFNKKCFTFQPSLRSYYLIFFNSWKKNWFSSICGHIFSFNINIMIINYHYYD